MFRTKKQGDKSNSIFFNFFGWIFKGGIIGTSIFNCFSNYNISETSLLCMYFCVLTGIWVYKFPMTSEIKAFTTILFAFFFFGNCMMILLIKLSFYCAHKKLKGDSFYINSLMCSLLDNFPAPLIYGFINDKYKKTYPNIAMACNLNFICVDIILLGMNYIFRKREKLNKEKEESLRVRHTLN